MNHFFENTLKPTFIENWSKDLKRLSIPGISIPLSLEQAKALGSNIGEFGEAFGERQNISELEAELDKIIQAFPNGAFVRLGSRSPKDSYVGFKKKFKVTSGKEAIEILTDCSERIYDDLQMALAHNYEPHIWVREWINIPEWAEFRCFVKQRKLIGISQYCYFDFYPEIKNKKEEIKWAIKTFFNLFFVQACHLDDVVFDVFVKKISIKDKSIEDELANTNIWEVKLIEINPFCVLTDPCLFEWKREGDDLTIDTGDNFFQIKEKEEEIVC